MRITRLAMCCLLVTLSTAVAADIYIYRHKDGTVLITEHPQTANQNYSLMDVKKTQKSTNNLPRINVHNAKPVRQSKKASRSPYDSTIKAISLRYGVDDKLVKAIVRVESAFKPRAVSPQGCAGINAAHARHCSEIWCRRQF